MYTYTFPYLEQLKDTYICSWFEIIVETDESILTKTLVLADIVLLQLWWGHIDCNNFEGGLLEFQSCLSYTMNTIIKHAAFHTANIF